MISGRRVACWHGHVARTILVGILAGMQDTEYTLHARCEDMESYYSYDSIIDKSRVRTPYTYTVLTTAAEAESSSLS